MEEEAMHQKSFYDLNGAIAHLCLCSLDSQATKDCITYQLTSFCRVPLNYEEEVLIFSSTICLVLDLYKKQHNEGYICSGLEKIIQTCLRNSSQFQEFLVEFIFCQNQFLVHTISQITSSMSLLLTSKNFSSFLNILVGRWDLRFPTSGVVLDIFTNMLSIVDQTKHPKESPNRSSCILKAVDSQENQNMHIVMDLIRFHWANWCDSYISQIQSLDVQYILSFLILWEKLTSFTNKNQEYMAEEFMRRADELLGISKNVNDSMIHGKLLDILVKTLNYGRTICIQSKVSYNMYKLAHSISAELLESPIVANFPTNSPDAENVQKCFFLHASATIPHKIVLLFIKSLAVLGKYSSTTNEDILTNLQTTEMKIQELSLFMESKGLCRSKDHLAISVVSLCADQDNWLIEAMLCCLDIYLSLQESNKKDVREQLNPHHTFVEFLKTIDFDHKVLLDYLISNETCFLIFLLRYLKAFHKDWDSVKKLEQCHVLSIVSVLRSLKASIEKLVSKNLFPYNVKPILKWISACDSLYVETNWENYSSVRK